jgi:uncharacterized membrane protein
MSPPNRWGPSSLGMDANLAAGLSYLATILVGPILAIIFFFVEKTNRFVKFHSAQVILLNIAGFVLGILLWVLFFVFAAGSAAATANSSAAAGASFGIGALFAFCLFPLVALAFFGLWLWGMIAAFSGKYTKLPLIGDIAESWAGGPATPMY